MSLLHSEILCKWKCSSCMRYLVLWSGCESACHSLGGIFSWCWLSITALTCAAEGCVSQVRQPYPSLLLRVPLMQPATGHYVCCFLRGARAAGLHSQLFVLPPALRNTSFTILCVCIPWLCALFRSFYFFLAPYDQMHTGHGLHRARDKGVSRAWRDVLAASC